MARKLLYVLTDGGRARIVKRSGRNGQFVTIEELDNSAALRSLRRRLHGHPPIQTMNRIGDRRHALEGSDRVRQSKEDFVGKVASRACAQARDASIQGLVLAAPRRLIGLLRKRIGKEVEIAHAIGKDLTKAPDHVLRSWLVGANL